MNYRQAINTDLKQIKELLKMSRLPSKDCEEHIKNFIVTEEKNKIVGIGGLEIYGPLGLVRSIVVKADYQNRGVAREIYQLIESMAIRSGVKELYLLTENAAEYFKKLGFSAQLRAKTPPPIRETRQFKELCPSSATVMFHEISNKSISS